MRTPTVGGGPGGGVVLWHVAIPQIFTFWIFRLCSCIDLHEFRSNRPTSFFNR